MIIQEGEESYAGGKKGGRMVKREEAGGIYRSKKKRGIWDAKSQG